MIKKNKGMTFVEILIVVVLLLLLIWIVTVSIREQDKPREGKYGVRLNTSDTSLTYSYCPDAYLLSNISCAKQTVSLYRGKDCLVYIIDANSSYYIPANVVFDKIESESLKESKQESYSSMGYVMPFGTKVVK